VRPLYNTTDWLWDEGAPVRRIEIDMPDKNWRALLENPTAETYEEGTVRLGEKSAKLAQKLGQLQLFIAVYL
jgi:hypothetical protein